MFNPFIVLAIIIQMVIAGVSRIAGAVVGYIITTGILIWGLGLYGSGYQIAFFGIPLSQTVFMIAILAWYVFDTKEFIEARNGSSMGAV